MARYFARLRAAVLECPGGCGRLYDLRATRGTPEDGQALTRRYWDPLSGRFECPGCGKVFQLGVVAWALPRGPGQAIPADWRPTLQQARWLRDKTRGQDGGHFVKEQGANLVEGADWQDVAELEGEVPPEEPKARRGRPPDNEPGKRSAPQAPTYGSTWRKPRGQPIAPPASPDAAEEGDLGEDSDE